MRDRLRRFDAVAFDLDGVLLDAVELHHEALARALADHGFVVEDSVLRSFNGHPTRSKLVWLSEIHLLPLELHVSVHTRKQEITRELIDSTIVPIPEHEALLLELRTAGYKIGVATNAVRATTELALERLKLAALVNAAISNEDVTNPKPAPDVYKAVAAALQCNPRRVLAVEDTTIGVLAARRAGAEVLTVSGVHDLTSEKVLARLTE